MLNSVTLVGRAGDKPDVKNFNTGAKVATINMAINRPTKKDEDGNKQETDWIEIKLWGKPAEVAEQYIKKGHLFGVQGRLRQETWEKDGQKRSKIVVSANELRLMQPKTEDGGQQSADTSSNEGDIFSACNF